MSVFYLQPSAIAFATDSANGGWSHGGAPTVAQLNKKYGLWDDSTAAHAFWTDATGPNTGDQLRVTMDTLPPVFTIQSVALLVRIQRSGGTFTGAEHRPFIYIGATAYYVDGWSNTLFGYYNQTISWTTNPATALPFTRADVNGLKAGLYARNLDTVFSTGPFCSAMILIVTATGAPEQIEQARDVASRHQWRYGHNVRELKGQSVPQEVGHGLDIMGQVKVVHSAGPISDGDGWQPKEWQVRHFQVRGWEPHDDGTVIVSGPERRELRAMYVDSLVLPDNTSPASEDGLLRFHKGATSSFARTGAVYSQDPGSGLLTLANTGEKQYGLYGYEALGAYTNSLKYSAFQAGNFTNWTKAGTGTNGSDVAADTAFVIGGDVGETFGWDVDSTGVTQNALFTAGTPHTADLKLTSDATASFTANSKLAYSVWFSDYSTAGELCGALQRQIDNFYYNFSSQSWQAGIFWQNLNTELITGVNLHGTLHSHQSWHFSNIDVGAGATTVKLIVGFPNGVTSGITARAYAAQLGNNSTTGAPPLLTTTAAVTRAQSLYKVNNTISKNIVNRGSGSIAVNYRPMMRGSEQAANTNRCLWLLYHDSNNHMMLTWSNRGSASGDLPAGTGFVFQMKGAGVIASTIISTASLDVVPNRELRIIARWTANSEYDLTYMLTLFISGYPTGVLRSADVSYSGAVMEVTDESYLEIGRATVLGTSPASGSVTRLVSRQYPPSDDECYRSGWTV